VNHPIRHLFLFLFMSSLCFFQRPATAEISYSISLSHPEQHLFRVSMVIPDVSGELLLQMPAWDALYQIRDFSSHVQEVDAFANGQKLAIEKIDKLTWHVTAHGTLTVTYSVFWDDPGPFSTQLNAEHAFINPAQILLYIPDRRKEKSTVTLSGLSPEWKVASSALIESDSPHATHDFQLRAPSYDALVDDPIEVSKFTEFTLPDITPTVHVVIHGDNWKRHDVETALRKVCAYELKLMDGAPYPEYTFLFHIGNATNGAGGGMEHANSTAIYIPTDAALPNIAAHEYFHLWNVKRLRPASLEPIDYTHEMYTRALWFSEGVTNTYASYTLVRTGLWNKQEFYQDLGEQISDLESRPADQWQSAEQSSLDAWLEKYALYNQPQRSISYYTKGQVLGFLLDILIRERTDNQKSLDDVFRAMNSEFAKQGKFYRDSLDVRLATEKVAGSSFEDFFSKYISGAEPIPYSDLLGKAGLQLRTVETVRPLLGFALEHQPSGPWVVASIEPDSQAAKSGLRIGDEVVRWNNGEPPRRSERWLAQQKPGDIVHLRVRRDDKEESIDVHLGEFREKFYKVVEAAAADQRAKRLRDGLLHGTTNPVTVEAR
jgi:predicted metalloprotease with PDZ domain